MSATNPCAIDLDWQVFDPWRIQPFCHQLMAHPLLDIGSLVELGQRLESKGRVRTHSNDAQAGRAWMQRMKKAGMRRLSVCRARQGQRKPAA
mgnify:CR=1 FL=1